MSVDLSALSEPVYEPSVVLDLRDLLPDSGGEIVVRMTGLDTLTVATDRAVAATGTAEAHVTAAGENVAGLRYYQLDGGVTLYCALDTQLMFGAQPV